MKANIAVWTPPNRKHLQLVVKVPDKNEWESIAIIKVPLHEFWEKLGTGLGITITIREEE